MSTERIATALLDLQLALRDHGVEIDHICLENEGQGQTLIRQAMPYVDELEVDNQLGNGAVKFVGIKICWPKGGGS